MIAATINQAFTAVLDGAETGRAAHLTVEVWDSVADNYLLAASGTGITEDPDSPGRYTATRTVTVGSAPDLPFELRWREDGEIAGVEDLTVVLGLVPSTDEIGTLLHARTVAGGTELGTFTDATRPTATEVHELAVTAQRDLAGRVGQTIPASLADDARQLAALQAASLVEASFFPDSLDTDRSAYKQYQAMYLNGVEALIQQLEGNAPNQQRAFSMPMRSAGAYGSTGLLDPFNTGLLP